MKTHVKHRPESDLAKCSRAWLVYFFLSIGVVGFLFAYVMALPFLWLGRIFPPAARFGGKALAIGVSILLKVQPWLKLKTDIRIPQNEQRVVTVSNHRSHFDMFVLLSRIPNVRVIAKQSLASVPFLGIMVRAMRSILVRQGDLGGFQAAMDSCERAIEKGDHIHLFPEGTRCAPGSPGTGRFQLPPFKVLRKSNALVVPIVFVDTDILWPKGTNGLRYGTPVSAFSLSPISSGDFASAAELRSAVQNKINEALTIAGTQPMRNQA